MKAIRYLLGVALAVIMNLLPNGNSSNALHAQKILKDTVLYVVKSFQPTIADAIKINEMPVVKDSVPPTPILNYQINSKKINTPFSLAQLKSAKMVGEPLTKLYNSLLKIGGGNYNTPYSEFYYNNLRSKEATFGTHLKHLSSKSTYEGYGLGNFSDNEIGLYGKRFFRKHTLSGDVDYARNVIHYYGYDTSAIHLNEEENGITKQRYSFIQGKAAYQSHYTDSLHINHLFNINYYNLSDYYNVAENFVSAKAEFSGFYEKQLIHVPLILDYYHNRDTADTAQTVIARLNPYIISEGNKWRTRIGMGIAMEAEESNKGRFLFYPNIDFNYNVLENIIVPYAGITGGLQRNSLKTLSDENPFLVTKAGFKNTNTRWKMYGGVKGSISKSVSYNASTSYSRVQDFMMFVNQEIDFIRKGFNTVYDDVNIWNLHGELQFQNTEKFKLIAKADYNTYDLKTETQAWHRPQLQGTLTANYSLKNKIIAKADIFIYGKRFSRDIKTDSLVTIFVTRDLKEIIDANIGLEYRYSKKLSAFVNFNNLGFKRYMMWNNYPTQKFNFLAGITMVF